jgi:hypothetical protein
MQPFTSRQFTLAVLLLNALFAAALQRFLILLVERVEFFLMTVGL